MLLKSFNGRELHVTYYSVCYRTVMQKNVMYTSWTNDINVCDPRFDVLHTSVATLLWVNTLPKEPDVWKPSAKESKGWGESQTTRQ